MSKSQDWWDGYQACIQDVLRKRLMSVKGEQIGFLAQYGKDTVGEYYTVYFVESLQKETPPIGYAVSVAGMVSMVSGTNALEDGTYLLHATKIADNVQLAIGIEATKRLMGEQA